MKAHATHADTALSEPAAAAVGVSEATRAMVALGCPRTAQYAALQMRINQSPRMVAQRRTMQALLGSASTTDSDRAHPSAVQAEPHVEVQPNQTGMPNQLKAGIESLSGMDMSGVRVHRNSDKPAQLSALAYAQGNRIHLGPGQEQHLPHEAWHVVQQRQGRVRETVQMAGVGVNDEEGLEREADVMGGRALAGAVQLTAEGKRQDLTPQALRPDPASAVTPQAL